MPDNVKTKAQLTATEERIKSFPCWCDHCPWAGTVGDAHIVDGKAQCPECGGSLAASRPRDPVVEALHACLNLEGSSF